MHAHTKTNDTCINLNMSTAELEPLGTIRGILYGGILISVVSYKEINKCPTNTRRGDLQIRKV